MLLHDNLRRASLIICFYFVWFFFILTNAVWTIFHFFHHLFSYLTMLSSIYYGEETVTVSVKNNCGSNLQQTIKNEPRGKKKKNIMSSFLTPINLLKTSPVHSTRTYYRWKKSNTGEEQKKVLLNLGK